MGASAITQLGAASTTTAGTTTFTVPANTRWLIKNITGSHVRTGGAGTDSATVNITVAGITIQLVTVSSTGAATYGLTTTESWLAYYAGTGTVQPGLGPNPNNIVLNAGDTITLVTVVASGSVTNKVVVSGVAYSLA
jgi:hypothetical protein